MSGPMGHPTPMPPWWTFVIGALLMMFVGIPLLMVLFITMVKWTLFVLTTLFG